MSQTITPVPQYDTTALVRTVDGELISDTSGPAPYGPLLQTLADRAIYARGSLWGQLIWGGRFSVDPGGTSSTFAVRVSPIAACCVRDAGGIWRPYFTAAETVLTAAHIEGGGNLANSTWYYVYAYSDGTTTLRFLINTTPPDASVLWQSAGGDGTRRYLGCFRTTSGGAPIPVRMTRGRYLYRYSSITSAYNIQAYAGAQAFTDLDLSAILPPHARIAHLRVEVINGDADADDELSVRVRTNGDTIAHEGITVPPAEVATADNYARGTFSTEIETDASQLIEVEVSGSSGSIAVNVFARGFTE